MWNILQKGLPGAPHTKFLSRCVKNSETGVARVFCGGVAALSPAPPASQNRSGPACSLTEGALLPLSNPPVGAAGQRPEWKAPSGPALGEPRMRPALRARRGTGKIETGMRGVRSARRTSPATPFTLPMESAAFTHAALRVIGGVGMLRGARREGARREKYLRLEKAASLSARPSWRGPLPISLSHPLLLATPPAPAHSLQPPISPTSSYSATMRFNLFALLVVLLMAVAMAQARVSFF